MGSGPPRTRFRSLSDATLPAIFDGQDGAGSIIEYFRSIAKVRHGNTVRRSTRYRQLGLSDGPVFEPRGKTINIDY